jgi:hypothetical protein
VLAAGQVPGFTPAGPVTVLVQASRRVRRERSFDVRRVDLHDVPSQLVNGLRVVLLPRALADAAASTDVEDGRLRVAVDHLRNRLVLDVVEAAAVWAAGSDAGSRRLHAMRRDGVFDMESEGERDAFRVVLSLLPEAPDCQVQLAANIRVDFAVLSAVLVIEYHGAEAHDRTADHDATRTWALRVLGYEVIVITRSMLRDPVALANQLTAIIARRRQLIRDGHLRLPALPAQPPRLTPLRTTLAA